MVVRAKRLGWNEVLTSEQEWDLDPYEAESDELEGELKEYVIPATAEHPTIHVCLVNGQEADPDSIVKD